MNASINRSFADYLNDLHIFSGGDWHTLIDEESGERVSKAISRHRLPICCPTKRTKVTFDRCIFVNQRYHSEESLESLPAYQD